MQTDSLSPNTNPLPCVRGRGWGMGGRILYFLVCFLSQHLGQYILETGRVKCVSHSAIGKDILAWNLISVLLGPYDMGSVIYFYFTEQVRCKV